MDCDCRHESLMRPACRHIYSTTREPKSALYKRDTGSKKAALFSFHVQRMPFYQDTKKNLRTWEKNKSAHARFIWLAELCGFHLPAFGFPHTPLWSGSLAVWLAQHPKHVKLCFTSGLRLCLAEMQRGGKVHVRLATFPSCACAKVHRS